jgi:ribosome maturation factor RimP
MLITQQHILTLANNHLKNGSLFVTGIKIGSDNSIQVFIDGDDGVTIADCVALSRAIEGNLDREQMDFSLDVSSHGAVTPLVMPRQYKKHIGRTLEVKLENGDKVEGILTEISETNFILEFTARENKPIGKGKINVVKQILVNFSEIKEAKIKLKY